MARYLETVLPFLQSPAACTVPDFMYVVKKSSGEKELNIIVETKDVEGKDVLRGNEAAKIECARVFFESLSKAGYVVHFREQIKSKQIAQIISELLNN